jgi:catechol 2,3-dioxygenase-like lactoylglutathione lyase family enzyme
MTTAHGIHHITAISSSTAENYDFYTRILGLRFIKKTVNFDDPGFTVDEPVETLGQALKLPPRARITTWPTDPPSHWGFPMARIWPRP